MKKKVSLLIVLSLIVQMLIPLSMITVSAEGEAAAYKELESPSVVYNMNIDWKYKRASDSTRYPLALAAGSVVDANGKQFYEVDYDDSDWETVSVPHPVNALDSFDGPAFDAGESGLYRGFMFYRKNVTIPASDAGKKMFLEFEAFRQSVYVYVNGQIVGFYEAGVAPVGFDITDYVKAGEENLIAVATDNSSDRGESDRSKITAETRPGSAPGAADGYGYQWNTKDFNEVQGGITGNVNLYATGTVYQTLPLYNNLKTTGNYIYGTDYDIDNSSATINVKAEVRNETDADMDVTLQVDVVAMDGTLAYSFEQDGTVKAATDADVRYMNMVPEDAYAHETGNTPAPTDISTVDVSYITASAKAENMRFWSDTDPYLYTVYTYIKDSNGNVIDHQKKVTGFRKVEYDINDGGLKVNDKSVYLKGYAQRSTNEWAVVGVANDWLSDLDMQLVKESNANHIRWMHIAPNPVDIRAGDKYGVVSVVPAGDKEGDVSDRAWDQRVESMRDVMIYFRNNPSVMFWEAGNAAISAEHMQEITDLKAALDPLGGRFAGSRSLSSVDQINAAEYVGTMLNRYAGDAKNSMTSAGGKYMPIMETEFARDEAPRRVWDLYSPPDYDYVNKWLGDGASKKDGYDVWNHTSESFSVSNAAAYEEFYKGRVGGGGTEFYAGAAIMVWSDSNMHNRNTASENCRTSGKVDAIRIKKDAFYALQAVQSDEPKIHIVGHWNYPELSDETYWYNEAVWNANEAYWEYTDTKAQRDPTKKTVYVIGSPDVKKVEIYINGELAGTDLKPDNTFVYAFPEIDVTKSGEISAKAYDERDIVIAEDIIKTAGDAATIRLTPVTGPDGLIADGSDVMYFDVEVIDEEGNVCPLNYDRIDLSVSGEGVLLGGYNSGVGDKITTGKDYVFAECGVNRVFVKSTRNAGTVTLTASMDGVGQVSREITSVAFDNTVEGGKGLSLQMQRSYAADEKPEPVPEMVEAFKPLAAAVKADFSEEGNTKVVTAIDTTDYYTVTVNGKEVEFGETPYCPGAPTNVVSEVAPVLEALKAAGAPIEYTYQKTGEKPSYVTAGTLPVISITGGLKDETIETGAKLTQIDIANGYTTVILNQGAAQNLMDAQAEVTAAGELKAELKVMMGYLEGVTAVRDEENKVYAITYEAPAQAALLSTEANLFSESEVTMTSENSQVIINAGTAVDNAMLIYAVYDENGAFVKLDMGTSVSVAAGEQKVVDVPEAILSAEGTKKVMLWNSMESIQPLTPSVAVVEAPPIDYSIYQTLQYSEDYNSNTQTDGPDGTGYLSPTEGTKIFDGMGAILQSDSLISLDFRFDDPAATMSIKNGALDGGKWGPNISLNGTTFRTQTASNSWQTLATVNVGEWYSMEIEGKMAIAAPYAVCRVYKWENGEKTLIQTTNGMNLRQFGSASNGTADYFVVNPGISVDNVSVTSLYASEVAVSAMTNNIKANETVLLNAVATRKGADVTVPTFAWSLHDADGNPLEDDTVTINESGMLITTSQTQSQTITVRATAQTPGYPYGETKVEVTAIDTSSDTFDAIKLSADKDYVRLNENTTITPTVTMGGADVAVADEDIIWSVYNAANVREVKNIGVKVENGVVSVNEDVIPQTLTIRASNKSGSATAEIQLTVKPGNMILDGELGNLDTYVAGDAAEELITGVTLEEGSWDGTGYYKLTGARDFVGFPGNTSEHVLYSADMKFNSEGAGWVIWNAAKGKQGLQVKYTGGQLGIVQDSSKTPTYLNVDQTSWYNVQIMCSTGASPNSYAHLIVYKYDENGKRVNPETGEAGVPFVKEYIPMRNLSESQANHVEIQGGTSIDNVYCIKTTPDAIAASVDKNTMFAGQSVQGSVVASRNGVPFGYISSELIKWVIYDENNEKPLDTDMITIDPSGKMTVDALADTQSVYMRASTVDGLLYDAVKVDIASSDILTVNTIGFNEDYSKVVELDVTKNFYYVGDVTFAVAVYDSTETTLKSITTKKMSGKNIAMGEEPAAVSIDVQLPADFDKENDVLYVYTLTSYSENEAVTEDDGTITAAFDGDAISISAMPTFDASAPVIVMVLKPEATTTDVKDSDIAYLKHFTGTTLAGLTSVSLTAPTDGDYIIKIAGKVNGVSTISTGVVTK